MSTEQILTGQTLSELIRGDQTAVQILAGAKKAVVFFAHPDDVDFGAGGTVAALTQAGVEVTYAVLTQGDAGGFEDDRDGVVQQRQQEQRTAAAIAGVSEVLFLEGRDGYLEPTHEMIEQVVAIMRRIRPEVVISMHPERDWSNLHRSHPDHLACGEIVTRAAFPAVENNYAYPKLREAGLEAYRLPMLLFMAAPQDRQNLSVEISGTFERKIQGLDVHLSQHPDPAQMHAQVRQQCIQDAQAAGWTAATEPGSEGAADQASSRVPMAERFHAVIVNGPSTFAGF